MSEDTQFTESADDMADDTQTTDEDLIWAELAAEDSTAADDDQDDIEAADADAEPDVDEDADDAADFENEDQDDAEADDGAGDQEDRPENDAKSPTPSDLRAHAELLEQKFRSEQSRSIAQQKRADRLQQELDHLKRRLSTKVENDEDANQRLKALSEEYPDVVGPIVDEVRNLKIRQKDVSDLEQRQLERTQTELADMQSAEIAKFEAEHPDGMDVIARNADVFRDWIEDQPKFVREAFQANADVFNDGIGAAMVVSRFKAALSEAAGGKEQASPSPKPDTRLESRRRRQLDGAKATRSTSSQKVAGDIAPDTDDEEALWKYWAGKDAKG